MRLHDPYHMALSALSGFAGEGRFGAGTPLVVTTLARELGLSPTPVREALARLAGEGVIDHWPGRGYFSPGLATAGRGLVAHELFQRRPSATIARQAWAASPPLSPRSMKARASACSIVFTVTMP